MKHDQFKDIDPDILEEAIDKWIRGFKCQRNRQIIKDKLLNGMTFEEVAEIHDLSVRHVKNIVYNGELIIFSKLHNSHDAHRGAIGIWTDRL